ncbi:MAG TPA: PIN domain-containing protein, partial [Anaeromyxobacteraceae bacterium]
MKKNFILDTNVLLHDPRSIFAFDDNNVVVPIYVIEEIDNFKRDLSSLGRSARQVARYLDEFRARGKLREGVGLGDGKGSIRVLFAERALPAEWAVGHNNIDDRILAVAVEVRDREKALPAVFVTKDTNLRIRADALGLHAEDYDVEEVALDDLWTGIAEVDADAQSVNDFYTGGFVAVPAAGDGESPPPNEFVVLRDRDNPQHSAVGKYSAARQGYVPLIKIPKEGVWGIRPRNKEQAFALDLLLNDDVRLVTIVGKAGTGKTLLAI